MFKNKLGEDSPISKFIHLKIWCRDGVKSLMTLEEGEFKVPIDGCIDTYKTLTVDKNHRVYLTLFQIRKNKRKVKYLPEAKA